MTAYYYSQTTKHIPIQYPSKGFGEAIELLIARWVKLLDSGFFCFDTLCQLAYMIYITNAKSRINILSIYNSKLQGI